MSFQNLSKYLGKPVDENLSEEDYRSAINEKFNQDYKPTEKENNPRNTMRNISNSILENYAKDTGNYQDPKKSQDNFYNLPFDKKFSDEAIKDLGLSNVDVAKRSYMRDAGQFSPPMERGIVYPDEKEHRDVDYLAKQFLPKQVYVSPDPNSAFQTLIHELGHVKDYVIPENQFKLYGLDERVENPENIDKFTNTNPLNPFRTLLGQKELPNYDFKDAYNYINHLHHTDQTRELPYMYPFLKIKGKFNK